MNENNRSGIKMDDKLLEKIESNMRNLKTLVLTVKQLPACGVPHKSILGPLLFILYVNLSIDRMCALQMDLSIFRSYHNNLLPKLLKKFSK